ncbi:hypothetical protein ACQKP0_25500 [Heyndrickxia sp. NPDC080065]|uniref:hypothetical protein n=1 Tax=Heyndrickxia sp. NPDC080065 TaxID=3390568 RepID=UPI003CFEB19C
MKEKHVIGSKRNIGLVVCLTLFSAILSLIVFGVFAYNIMNGYNDRMSLSFLLISIIICIFLGFTKFVTIIHELSHKKTADFYNHKAEVILDKKRLEQIKKETKRSCRGYCQFNDGDEFRKHEFIRIAIAPFCILLLLIVISIFLFFINYAKDVAFPFSLLILFKLPGCLNDLQMILDVKRNYNEGDIIKYSAQKYQFMLHKAN